MKLRYSHPTNTGQSSTSDYEQSTYDAFDRLTQERRRDGQVYAYEYDNLGRLKKEDPPGSAPDIWTSYDLLGRVLSVGQTGLGVENTYDALGRVTSSYTNGVGTTSYQYDAAGRRTRLTYPDGFYVVYDYNDAGDLTKIRENGATSGLGVLATFAYDELGRRASLATDRRPTATTPKTGSSRSRAARASRTIPRAGCATWCRGARGRVSCMTAST